MIIFPKNLIKHNTDYITIYHILLYLCVRQKKFLFVPKKRTIYKLLNFYCYEIIYFNFF